MSEETSSRSRCEICREKFDTAAELLDHLFVVRDKKHDSYLARVGISCPICFHRSRSREGLLIHMVNGCESDPCQESTIGFLERRNDPKDLKFRFNSLLDLGPVLLQVWIGAARHSTPVIRKLAAIALGELGDERGMKTLARLLRDPNDEVVKSAVRALGKIGTEDSMIQLSGLLDDLDVGVRRTAAAVLMKAGSNAVQHLFGIVFDAEQKGWRTAIEILLRMEGVDVGSELKDGFYRLPKDRRALVLTLLAERPSEAGCSLVLLALMDPSKGVQSSAMAALRQQDAACKEKLLSALANKDAKLWHAGLKYSVRLAQAMGEATVGSSLKVQQELRELLSERPWELGYAKYVRFVGHGQGGIIREDCRFDIQKGKLVVTLANREELRIGVEDILYAIKQHKEVSADTIPELGKFPSLVSNILMELKNYWKRIEVLSDYQIRSVQSETSNDIIKLVHVPGARRKRKN